MLSDQSGNGILKENHLGVSAAYTKGLDMVGNHSITAGFQGSFSSLGFDQNKANFEDEISASGFTLPSSEILLTRDLGRQYVDMHAGLLYKGSFSENDLFYAGASIYHLKTPSLGFSSPNYFDRAQVQCSWRRIYWSRLCHHHSCKLSIPAAFQLQGICFGWCHQPVVG